MSRTTSKPVQMASITIGYMRILMPADKAMKVIELMQHAVGVEIHWTHNKDIYIVQPEALDVSFRHVPASDIRMPDGVAVPASNPTLRLPK